MQLAHSFTNTMRHEPSGLVGKPKHPVKLVSGDAFLAGAHQMRRKKPLGHGNVRPLVNCAHGRRELPAALFAVVPARPHRLAAQRLHGIRLAAERAVGTVRPADRFKVLPGLVGVGEDRIGKVNGGHGFLQ